MRRAIEWLKEEIAKVLMTAVFFSVAFCCIVVANRLLVRGYNVEIATFTTAVIGGLIVAKVLLVVDMLPIVDAFPQRPLIYNITWKSTLYIAASLVFRYLEPLVKALWAGAGIAGANQRAADEFTQSRFWSTQIWVSVLLVIFVTMQEFIRVLGKENVRVMVLGPPRRAQTKRQPRRAA